MIETTWNESGPVAACATGGCALGVRLPPVTPNGRRAAIRRTQPLIALWVVWGAIG
jgi:hypothetical protein